MFYTVGEIAKILGVTASTLRYYDKEGLLPFVERTDSGIRMFQEKDFEWLRIIECLKKAGMSIKNIKTYITLAMEGDSTIEERLSMFINQKKTLQKQIDDLEKTMHVLDYKCWYYETAKKKGSVEKVKNIPDEDVPEQFKEIRKELKAIKDGLN